MLNQKKNVSARPEVELKPYRGRPAIFINGEPVPLVMYSPAKGSRGFSGFWRQATERFVRDGVNIHLITVPQIRAPGKAYGEEFWQGQVISAQPLEQTCEEVDAGALFVLENDPDAWLMVRLHPRLSQEWARLHPDQLFVTEHGERLEHASLASSAFNDMLSAYCAAVISYTESRPWAGRVIGYVNYYMSEGTHPPVNHYWLFDHSEVMTGRWRAFLRQRYQTLEALRQAHGDDALTFENVSVPKDRLQGLQREVAAMAYWQAGPEQQALRDYLLLTRQLYLEHFSAVSEAMRKAAGRGRLLLHDTCKLPMQGWSLEAFFDETAWQPFYAELLAGSGNMQMHELLQMPSVDGLATPYDYQMRHAGGVFIPEGAADSIVLRNKLFFCEWDLRTWKGECGLYGTVRNLEEFKAVTWRDLATALTRGFANYYCDHNADYFAEPAMHEIISRQIGVIRDSLHWQHRTVPGIAMILDDQAVLETNSSGHVLHETVMMEQKLGLARCGVPFRVYLFEDLLLDDFPEHRVYYFPNLYSADEKRIAVLREKVFRNGNVIVWGPGSGISDGRTVAAGHSEKLTGFRFDWHKANYHRHVQVTDFEHPITRNLHAGLTFGGSIAYGPVLYPADGTRLGLAMSRRGGATSGLAVKTFGRGARGDNHGTAVLGPGDYAAVFTVSAPLPAELWLGLARYAGAHVYTDSHDIVLANNHLVAVHSLKSGPRRIELPANRKITDLVTGRLVAEDTSVIVFDLKAPATHVFYLDTPAT